MMTRQNSERKGLYIGGTVGLALFAMAGFIPGALFGGAAGLDLAGKLFGLPLGDAFLPRLVVALSMFTGAIVSALVLMTASSAIGAAIGHSVAFHHNKDLGPVTLNAK